MTIIITFVKHLLVIEMSSQNEGDSKKKSASYNAVTANNEEVSQNKAAKQSEAASKTKKE